MKTKQVVDKYRKLLSGLLKTEEDKVRFFIKSAVPYGTHWNYDFDKDGNPKNKEIREIKEIAYTEPEKKDGEETGNQVQMTRWNDWSEGAYCVTVGKDILSTFELYKLPHCCAILVSCKAFVSEKYRNKRVGTTMNSLRQDLGRLLGYSTLLCTDIETNKHQRQLLETNGWKDIYSIRNKRTNNQVHVHVINL